MEKLVPGAAADIDDQDSRTDCSMLVLQVDNTGRHHQHLTRKRECSRLSPTTPRSIHAVALSQREIKVLCPKVELLQDLSLLFLFSIKCGTGPKNAAFPELSDKKIFKMIIYRVYYLKMKNVQCQNSVI